MKNRYLLALFLVFTLPLTASSADAWLTDFSHRKNITLYSPDGSSHANYSVYTNITYDSDMQANFDDIRFTDSSDVALGFCLGAGCIADNTTALGTTECAASVYCEAWFLVDNITDSNTTTVFMYYGNLTAASNTSNFGAAFRFADNFDDDSINASLWGNCDATFSETGKAMKGAGDGTVDRCISTLNHTAEDLFESEFTTPADAQHAYPIKWYTGAVAQGDGVYFDGGADDDMRLNLDGSWTNSLTNFPFSTKIDLRIFLSGATFWGEKNAERTTDANTAVSVNDNLGIGCYIGDVFYDWVRIRGLAEPEPYGIYEAEEERTPSVTITSPTNATHGENATFSLEYTFNQNGSATCNTSFYSLDGAANVSMGCVNTTFTVSTTGAHNITIWANDSNGDVATATLYFTIESAIISCSDPDAVEALNFTFSDEDNTTVMLNGSAEYAMHITTAGVSHTWNDSHTNVTNITICIPSGSSYTVNMTMLYRSSGYEQRTYYFYSAAISGTLQEIELFCIDTTDGEKLEVTAKDANDNTVSEVYIDLDRYYPETDDYETVAILKTDGTGKALTYIDLDDVFYRFTLSQGGIVVNSYGSMTITDTADDPETMTLYVAAEDTQFFDMMGKIGYSCYFNTSTNVTSCSVVDPSGLVTSARLVVEEQSLTGFNTICEDTDSGTSFTLTCSLGADPNGTYRYFLELTPSPNPPYVVTSDIIRFAENLFYGDTGVFLAFLIVALCGLGAIVMGPVAAIVAVIGLALAAAMGLVDIGVGSIISLLIIGALIFMKGRGI